MFNFISTADRFHQYLVEFKCLHVVVMTAVSSLVIFFCGVATIIMLIIFAIDIVGGLHYFDDDLTGVTEQEQ